MLMYWLLTTETVAYIYIYIIQDVLKQHFIDLMLFICSFRTSSS